MSRRLTSRGVYEYRLSGHEMMLVSSADQFWQYAKEALLAAYDAKIHDDKQNLFDLAGTVDAGRILERSSSDDPDRRPKPARRKRKVRWWPVVIHFHVILLPSLRKGEAPVALGKCRSRWESRGPISAFMLTFAADFWYALVHCVGASAPHSD